MMPERGRWLPCWAPSEENEAYNRASRIHVLLEIFVGTPRRNMRVCYVKVEHMWSSGRMSLLSDVERTRSRQHQVCCFSGCPIFTRLHTHKNTLQLRKSARLLGTIFSFLLCKLARFKKFRRIGALSSETTNYGSSIFIAFINDRLKNQFIFQFTLIYRYLRYCLCIRRSTNLMILTRNYKWRFSWGK